MTSQPMNITLVKNSMLRLVASVSSVTLSISCLFWRFLCFRLFFFFLFLVGSVKRYKTRKARNSFLNVVIVHLIATLSNKIFFSIQQAESKCTIDFNNPLLWVDKCLWKEKLEISIRGYRTKKIHFNDCRFSSKMLSIQQKV